MCNKKGWGHSYLATEEGLSFRSRGAKAIEALQIFNHVSWGNDMVLVFFAAFSSSPFSNTTTLSSLHEHQVF